MSAADMLDAALTHPAGPTLPAPIVFDVEGVPAPQGSKKAVRRGNRTALIEMSKKVGPWRDAVAMATRSAMAGRPPVDGPVAVHVDFWMPRPSTARAAQIWQATTPDLDKLLRSTGDALKTGGAIKDDSLIVAVAAHQRYVPHMRGRRSTVPTGARITLWALAEVEAAGVNLTWAPTLNAYTTAPTWAPLAPGGHP